MNQIPKIIAALLFSVLFFKQSLGLNMIVFSLVTLVVLIFYNKEKFKTKSVLLLSVTFVLSGFIVFINHSLLSILSYVACFFTLVGTVASTRASIYVKWFNGIYSSVAGYFQRTFDKGSTESTTDSHLKKEIDVFHVAKLIGIPLIFIIIFILLYKNGNPIFEELIDKINFDFINFQWLLFTFLGYFLISNISKPITVEPITENDIAHPNELVKKTKISEDILYKEQQLGTTLLGLLNILLIVFIITDLISIIQNQDLASSEMSQQVHKGVNTLIASILIAISIILYFFRGSLNFYEKNRTLKTLTYCWIILNIVLVLLIAIKNYDYITTYGLTYKRIGVNIYIFLTLVGLVSTFIKVLSIKNLAFLFRRNTQIAFLTLVICSLVNWDKTITAYNIQKAEQFIGVDYLIRLSDRNAKYLFEKIDEFQLSDTDRFRVVEKFMRYKEKSKKKNWQELHWEAYKIKYLLK